MALTCEEKAKRLKAALAKAIAESIKHELRMMILYGEHHDQPGVRKLVRQRASVTSFGDLHDYVDANMLPVQSEWLLSHPLVKDNDFGHGGDADGAELAIDVLNTAQNEVDDWIKAGGLMEMEITPAKETEPYGV